MTYYEAEIRSLNAFAKPWYRQYQLLELAFFTLIIRIWILFRLRMGLDEVWILYDPDSGVCHKKDPKRKTAKTSCPDFFSVRTVRRFLFISPCPTCTARWSEGQEPGDAVPGPGGPGGQLHLGLLHLLQHLPLWDGPQSSQTGSGCDVSGLISPVGEWVISTYLPIRILCSYS